VLGTGATTVRWPAGANEAVGAGEVAGMAATTGMNVPSAPVLTEAALATADPVAGPGDTTEVVAGVTAVAPAMAAMMADRGVGTVAVARAATGATTAVGRVTAAIEMAAVGVITETAVRVATEGVGDTTAAVAEEMAATAAAKDMAEARMAAAGRVTATDRVAVLAAAAMACRTEALTPTEAQRLMFPADVAMASVRHQMADTGSREEARRAGKHITEPPRQSDAPSSRNSMAEVDLSGRDVKVMRCPHRTFTAAATTAVRTAGDRVSMDPVQALAAAMGSSTARLAPGTASAGVLMAEAAPAQPAHPRAAVGSSAAEVTPPAATAMAAGAIALPRLPATAVTRGVGAEASALHATAVAAVTLVVEAVAATHGVAVAAISAVVADRTSAVEVGVTSVAAEAIPVVEGTRVAEADITDKQVS
jgi:hypothetical protein